MTRETSSEPPKPSKRKGTRSVSTLTPAQLARKRANDREAQRAIRARTKEHIERLEKELEEYRTRQSRDEVINQLKMRLNSLERENNCLREELKRCNHMFSPPGTSQPSPPACLPPAFILTTPAPGFDANDLLPAAHAGIPHRPAPFGQPANEYTSTPPAFAFVPTTEQCEQWPSTVSVSSVPVSSVSVSSVVSSPCPSPSHPEDPFLPNYIPTSMPTMMEGNVMAPTSMPCMDATTTKLEFEQQEIDPGTTTSHGPEQISEPWTDANSKVAAAADHGYPNANMPQPATAYIPQQPWSASMYPPTYYQHQPHGLPQAAGL
ncbi:hypothetical protein QBC40DRAFT_259425 [Triangularia verruculosa]|uniref:BZIP transcription factor n=1 Tax=Triangularia verruculosa TaxID=2587418 RepID=A0AAN6XBY4_9PEZI|nr:hypothetical protein QBC40DRAFT_259425 [Triangularia verruculosa]